MNKKSENKNIIKSAIKIFDVLELVMEANKVTVTEASNETGYTKSTIQRILNTLRYLDYIDQDPDTLEYYPTFKLYNLGNHILINNTIKNIARPHLVSMSEEINETINLGILDNYQVIYLDKIVSNSPLRVDINSSMDIPIYSSALGKSIAAFSKDSFSFDSNYRQFTKNTISSDREWEEELSTIRRQGYSLDKEEFVEGLICIGVPILDKNNNSIASLSISIPDIRFQDDRINEYVDLLNTYAKKIEQDLFKNRKHQD